MSRLSFPLNITLDSPRPIFNVDINGVIIKCMFDTGADIPVFCKGTDLFLEFTKSMAGVSEFQKSSVGGFGKTAESTTLWNVREFKLSDKKECITYRNLKIAVLEKPKIPCDLILSASMFMKMKYTIDCLSDKHSLIVESARDTYGVGFYKRKETIYIFAEDDKVNKETANTAAASHDEFKTRT